jgi:hypothetical protein
LGSFFLVQHRPFLRQRHGKAIKVKEEGGFHSFVNITRNAGYGKNQSVLSQKLN